MAGKLYDWFDARLKLQPLSHTFSDTLILGGTNWIYVFWSATLFLFCLHVTTDLAFTRHALFLPILIVGGMLLYWFIFRQVGPADPWIVAETRQRSEMWYPRHVYLYAVVMVSLFLSHLHAGSGMVLSLFLSISERHIRTIGTVGHLVPSDRLPHRSVVVGEFGLEAGSRAGRQFGGDRIATARVSSLSSSGVCDGILVGDRPHRSDMNDMKRIPNRRWTPRTPDATRQTYLTDSKEALTPAIGTGRP